MRTWLNGKFYEEAFSEEEQNCIRESGVTTDLNPGYDTNQTQGPGTMDKIFLLSVKEAKRRKLLMQRETLDMVLTRRLKHSEYVLPCGSSWENRISKAPG